MGEICSKLTVKTIERRQWHRYSVFICLLWTDFIHCFGVSNIDFEQVNAGWDYWLVEWIATDCSKNFSSALNRFSYGGNITCAYVAAHGIPKFSIHNVILQNLTPRIHALHKLIECIKTYALHNLKAAT